MISKNSRLISLLPTKLICKLEFKRQKFFGFNERPVEYGFVFKHLSKIYPDTVLDVGTGTTSLPHMIRSCGPLVTAVDNIKDYWPSGMSNRHYHILDKDITKGGIKGKYDLITCISVLEHIIDHDKAVQNMFDLLNDQGHLIITCPYTEKAYIDNVYKLNESNAYGKNIPFLCRSYSRENIDAWIKNRGQLVAQEYWQFWSGTYWSTGTQIIPPVESNNKNNHQLTCILIKKP